MPRTKVSAKRRIAEAERAKNRRKGHRGDVAPSANRVVRELWASFRRLHPAIQGFVVFCVTLFVAAGVLGNGAPSRV